MNNQKRRIRSVTINDRGQIVIPEDIRKNKNIKGDDTLILIETDGEIIMKREEDVVSAIGEDDFWKEISKKSLSRAWEKDDSIKSIGKQTVGKRPDAKEWLDDFLDVPKHLRKNLTVKDIKKILDEQYEEEYDIR